MGSMLPLVICCVLVGTSVAQVDPVTTTEAALVSRVQALEAKLLTLVEKVNSLEEKKDVKLVKRSLFDIPHHRELRDRVLIGGPSNIYASAPVAMFVSLTETTTVHANSLVPYTQTYTAGGLTSIPKSASFVSPRNCYCLISITVLATESNVAILELKHNHRNVFKAWSDNRSGTHTQGGGSVVLRLQKGDRLEVRSGYETELKGDDVNTFSVLCFGN